MSKTSETPELPSLQELEEELKRVRYKKSYHTMLRSTLGVLVVVAALAVLVATLWLPVLQTNGTSMTPTLGDGEIILSVKTNAFETGDIVSFYYNNKILVKRIIAGPGDWVNMDTDGNVYVNDVLLDEPYLEEKSLGDCNIELPFQVPDERYFVLGDHRSVSKDSRTTAIGCVSEEQMVGKIVFILWPFSHFGPVS